MNAPILDDRGQPIPRREPWYRRFTSKSRAALAAITVSIGVVAGLMANVERISSFLQSNTAKPAFVDSAGVDEGQPFVGNKDVSPILARNQVAEFNRYESLPLNPQRRNAVQNKTFAEWIERTQVFKQQYLADQLPSKDEYETFIFQFTEFAECTFTPLQIKSFEGMESGAGGEMFRHPDDLSNHARKQFLQLALIEFWLIRYTELNLKSEEPLDPVNLSI